MLIKFSFPKGSKWQNKILSFKSMETTSVLFLSAGSGGHARGRGRRRWQRWQGNYLSPHSGTWGWGNADVTLFSQTVKKGVEVLESRKLDSAVYHPNNATVCCKEGERAINPLRFCPELGQIFFLPGTKKIIQLVWKLIALVKITAVTTVGEGQKCVLSWVLQIRLHFGGREKRKNSRLYELNMNVVIWNFQRIAQHKNPCVQRAPDGIETIPVLTALCLDLTGSGPRACSKRLSFRLLLGLGMVATVNNS